MQEDAQLQNRWRRPVAAAALVVVTILVIWLVTWLTTTPAQRTFVATNMPCLQCHTELLADMHDTSVHQPFLTQHCTSCHTPHGRRTETSFFPKTIGWIQRLLAWLQWLPFVTYEEPTPTKRVTMDARLPSNTQVATDKLCWTCHGDLAPSLENAVGHQPFVSGNCMSCHLPHASRHKSLLRAQGAKLCYQCHPLPGALGKAQVHQPFGAGECTSCHAAHGSEYVGMLRASEWDLCLGCHPTVAVETQRIMLHSPVGQACTSCHQPHSADANPLLNAATPGLCYGCHSDVQPQFSASSAHPVSSGRLDCPDCHEPHAANFTGLLVLNQPQLCYGCHEDFPAKIDRRVVHKPVDQGRCTACHVPHGSNAAPLLERAVPSLCYGCHPQTQPHTTPASRRKAAHSLGAKLYQGHVRRGEAGPKTADQRVASATNRPTGFDAITMYPSTIPVPAVSTHPMWRANTPKCSSCHETHASDNDVLFTRAPNALCLGCHRSDVSRYANSAHRNLECRRCHSIHEPGYSPLVKQGNPEVCLGCHPHAGRHNTHPASPAYYDYLADTPLTCTSTCHKPHGTSFKHMLNVPYKQSGYGSDYVCLICHGKVGITY